MSLSPKFFRVATEGATIDGRTIQRTWLEQMAAHYQPHIYGARVFIEHIRGTVPDSPFKAYGDVLALKTQERPDGKLVLLAQIEPTPELIALVKAKQKIYASVEIDPDFADTKAAYLVGLGITDSPASLGTERLSFARQSGSELIFSTAMEMEEDTHQETPTVLTKVKTLLGLTKRQPLSADSAFADINQALETLASHSREQLDAFEARLTKLTVSQMQDREAFYMLQQQLESTPDHQPQRPLATGSRAHLLSDC